ncbi:MAG: response regulator [Deltaproteobacteria bacterium]|nr:response regulator [Deltaproteobacteria bacterium]MBW1960022.1 response regulator [Deltaproteobacteria bacterium]MBW2151214.1 response regulator [Deltaproteobacteria bacterium]
MGNPADILIIEDDRDLVDTMRIVLESKAYQVRAAYNGKEGYAEIEKKVPDVIILDVMMSTDTEGFDLAYKLQRNPEYKKIPILILTSFPKKMAEEGPEKFQHILGEDWPVTMFFEKPIDPEKLLSAIEDILGQKKDS